MFNRLLVLINSIQDIAHEDTEVNTVANTLSYLSQCLPLLSALQNTTPTVVHLKEIATIQRKLSFIVDRLLSNPNSLTSNEQRVLQDFLNGTSTFSKQPW